MIMLVGGEVLGRVLVVIPRCNVKGEISYFK